MNKKMFLYLIIILAVIGVASILMKSDSGSSNLSQDNKVTSNLCSQESKIGDFIVINNSSNGEYYQLSYSYEIYDQEGNVLGVTPVLDNPGAYYNSSGDWVGNCGGLLNETSGSFCTQTLPSLDFNTVNLCL